MLPKISEWLISDLEIALKMLFKSAIEHDSNRADQRES